MPPVLLEMDKPSLSLRSLYIAPLVRSVNLCVALLQDDPMFVWAVYRSGSKNDLRPGTDATEWRENIVVAVFLV